MADASVRYERRRSMPDDYLSRTINPPEPMRIPSVRGTTHHTAILVIAVGTLFRREQALKAHASGVGFCGNIFSQARFRDLRRSRSHLVKFITTGYTIPQLCLGSPSTANQSRPRTGR